MADKITMKTEVDLKPFEVPCQVTMYGADAGKFDLNELDEEVLNKLCNKFRADVFEKAGKTDIRK